MRILLEAVRLTLGGALFALAVFGWLWVGPILACAAGVCP